MSLFVLAVSGFFRRRTTALVGVFALLFIPWGAGRILARWGHEQAFRLIAPTSNFWRISEGMFEPRRSWFRTPIEWSWLALGALVALSLAVIWWRVRRLEVVP